MEQKRLIILGSGPEWRNCPYDAEVWAVGKMITLDYPPKKVDRLFQMDDLDHLLTIRRGVITREKYAGLANKADVPFYSVRTYEDIPKSIEYPLKKVMDKVGRVPYFQNAIAYMLALAIAEEYTEINLYGVAQMGAHEYTNERACVEFWLGVAGGMGRATNIMTPSSLLRGTSEYLYGHVRTIKQLNEDGKI